MPADQQRTDTDTVKVDLGGREVAVPKGGLYDLVPDAARPRRDRP